MNCGESGAFVTSIHVLLRTGSQHGGVPFPADRKARDRPGHGSTFFRGGLLEWWIVVTCCDFVWWQSKLCFFLLGGLGLWAPYVCDRVHVFMSYACFSAVLKWQWWQHVFEGRVGAQSSESSASAFRIRSYDFWEHVHSLSVWESAHAKHACECPCQAQCSNTYCNPHLCRCPGCPPSSLQSVHVRSKCHHAHTSDSCSEEMIFQSNLRHILVCVAQCFELFGQWFWWNLLSETLLILSRCSENPFNAMFGEQGKADKAQLTFEVLVKTFLTRCLSL